MLRKVAMNLNLNDQIHDVTYILRA